MAEDLAGAIRAQPVDWRAVVRCLTGPAPEGAAIWYQKHMAHHMLPEVGLDWLDGFKHAFLIRDPRAVVASYARNRARTCCAHPRRRKRAG